MRDGATLTAHEPMLSNNQKIAERELREVSRLQALRLREILAAIDARACEPQFCARSVAVQLGLSERYVRKLLQTAGASFSQARMRARLDRAHALLTDASCGALSVTEVSLAAGFADISYFNRSFRHRFGVTPTSLRKHKERQELRIFSKSFFSAG